MGIFDFNKKTAVRDQSKEVESLQKSIASLDKLRSDDQHQHERDTKELIDDHALVLRRKDAEVDVRISEATAELKEKLATKTAEASDAKKEAEILTKAFENLGFDVKDMKEILNKLVDGIVSGNKVTVLKS